jgi:3-mercaptopyruvate sulfurtransferase SseA
MRFIFSFTLFVLFGMLLLSACQTAQSGASTQAATVKSPEPAGDGVARISLEDAKKEFDANSALFVDSRPQDAFKDEHIKGAINIPLGDAESRWKELPTDKKIIVYCS